MNVVCDNRILEHQVAMLRAVADSPLTARAIGRFLAAPTVVIETIQRLTDEGEAELVLIPRLPADLLSLISVN